jgi:hypothetical protein
MKRILAVAALSMLIASCGVTRVTVSRPDVDIYINNVKQAKGAANVKRVGPPKKVNIVAKYQGQTVGELKAKRQFDLATVIIGLYSYGIGFGLAWHYPRVIDVPISMPQYVMEQERNRLPSEEIKSIWMKPPRIWGAP